MENQSKARVLPVFNMEGTDFYVDTRLNEFREVNAPWNRISMDEIREGEDGITGFVYDTLTKNIYEEIVDPEHIPAHVKLVIIPSLVELDPVGLARKYGLADDAFKGESPANNRQLPQIKVAGIDFYVDAISGNLIEQADTANRIYVLDMLTLEDHHEFLFDRQTKNIVDGNWTDAYKDHEEYIWIRRMEALDPEGMKVLEEMGKVPKLPENLPVVYIGDTAFYWLEAESVFCQADNHWNRIYKNDITTVDGEQGFYYDSILAQVPFQHELDSYKGDLPDHIYFKPVSPLLDIVRSLEQGASRNRRSVSDDPPAQQLNKGRRIR